MADSDDEYDRRKGRDKFRRERNDYERRDDRRRAWEHDRYQYCLNSQRVLIYIYNGWSDFQLSHACAFAEQF
jgi:hypothetical protein